MSQVHKRAERQRGWKIAGTLVGGAIAALLLGAQVDTPKGEAGESAQLPRPLDLLIGPTTRIGVSTDSKAFDELQLAQGKKYASNFPQFPSDLTASNYYDLALTLYTIYYRTGDPYWLNKARSVAQMWRDSVHNANMALCRRGVPGACANAIAPRGASTLGLAILAVENNDAAAKAIVHQQGVFMQALQYPTVWFDGRENGYTLMIFLANHLLGFTEFDASAAALLNLILNQQQPTGEWTSLAPDASGNWNIPVVMNYMNGILAEALIMYDRAIGDPRIQPAIKKWADWAWATQWVPAAQGFRYANRVVPDWTDTTPYPNLNGLFLPAWGYLYAKTGDANYLTQGNQILSGMLYAPGGGANGIYNVKQFDQMFRSSSRFLGYVGLTPSPK